MQAATIDMFDEVDRRVRQLVRAADGAPMPDALPFVDSPPLAPHGGVTWLPPMPAAAERRTRALIVAAVALALLGLAAIAAINIQHLMRRPEPLTGRAAIDAVVTRIIAAESRGAIDPKNARSTADGPAQFIEDTWLELIRAQRPDLLKGRNRAQLLALRRRPGLARELALRFAEHNAAVLSRRGLPVTAGTLYLAHFAGPAGAAALLSAPAGANAATVMARADASGKTRREQIVKANPFLASYTVADLRQWADRKMDGRPLVLTALLAVASTK